MIDSVEQSDIVGQAVSDYSFPCVIIRDNSYRQPFRQPSTVVRSTPWSGPTLSERYRSGGRNIAVGMIDSVGQSDIVGQTVSDYSFPCVIIRAYAYRQPFRQPWSVQRRGPDRHCRSGRELAKLVRLGPTQGRGPLLETLQRLLHLCS